MQQGNRVLVAPEGWRPLEGRVQRGAQGEDIGGKIGSLTPGNLWGEEGGGAMHHATGCQRGVTQGAGNAEVADQRRTVLGDQYIARLDIAVHDAECVSRGKRASDLRTDLSGLFRFQRSALG